MTAPLPFPNMFVGDGAVLCLGYEQISGMSGAKSLNPPEAAYSMIVCAEGQAVRFRHDATDPTATVGMPLAVGEKFPFTGELSKFKFIQQAAGAILNVTYYR